MSKLNAAALALTGGLLASAAWPQAPDSPPIVKPEIVKSWSMPVETGKDKITADQLSRCFATSANVRELYESVKARGNLVEPESADIADTAAALQRERADIDAREAELARQSKALDEKNAGFKRRGAEIERLRTAKLSPAEAKQGNAAIALFNQDLGAFNKELALFNAALPQHRANVAAYNAKIGPANERATQFNARAFKYKADAERLNQMLAQLGDWCVGERKIVK